MTEDILRAILEVLVRIVETLKKGRSFNCVQTSGYWIILVRMIFPGELPIMYFDLCFGCSQSKSEDGEQLEHASPNLRAEVLIAKPLFWTVWRRGGWSVLWTVLVHEGGVSRRRGGSVLSLSSRFVSMPSLSVRIIVFIGIVLTIHIVVAIVVIIVRGGASSVVSASCPPRRQRPPWYHTNRRNPLAHERYREPAAQIEHYQSTSE